MIEILAAAFLAEAAPRQRPGPVVMLRCHMMECGWYQPLSAETVRQGDGWRLLRVSARRGISSHLPRRNGEARYPRRFGRNVSIAWDPAPRDSCVLCSRSLPVSMFRSDDGRWIAHRLNLFGLPGYAESSAYIYLNACHGLGREALADGRRLRRLGYSDSAPTEQLELSSPEAILERLPR